MGRRELRIRTPSLQWCRLLPNYFGPCRLTCPFLQNYSMLCYSVLRQAPKSKLLGIVVAELLQAWCPSCHPTSSIKALTDEKTAKNKPNLHTLHQFYISNNYPCVTLMKKTPDWLLLEHSCHVHADFQVLFVHAPGHRQQTSLTEVQASQHMQQPAAESPVPETLCKQSSSTTHSINTPYHTPIHTVVLLLNQHIYLELLRVRPVL